MSRLTVSTRNGLQAGIEVVAGVGTGVLLGWSSDRWPGTSPLL
jgi:F0F1-type ATP synthase assembly protein I